MTHKAAALFRSVTKELTDAFSELARLSDEEQGRWAALIRLWLEQPAKFRKAEADAYCPTPAELLDSVTPGNTHPEFDFGPPVGKERFWE